MICINSNIMVKCSSSSCSKKTGGDVFSFEKYVDRLFYKDLEKAICSVVFIILSFFIFGKLLNKNLVEDNCVSEMKGFGVTSWIIIIFGYFYLAIDESLFKKFRDNRWLMIFMSFLICAFATYTMIAKSYYSIFFSLLRFLSELLIEIFADLLFRDTINSIR